MSDVRRRIRRLLPARYRRLFDVLSDVRNWYVAASVLLAAGIINYILTGSRVPPLAFVPPQYLEQSMGETATLVVLVGLGIYFVLLTGRSSRSSSEGIALAISIAAAILLMVWYLVLLALGGLV